MSSSRPQECTPTHNAYTLALSLFLCLGLIASYLPQLIRIVLKRSSLGFSPWFLLLGATSSASTFLNVVTLQWGVVRCCKYLTAGQCAENLLAVVQTGLQWLLFSAILALFLWYYPRDKRYERKQRRGAKVQPGSRVLTRTRTASTSASTDDGDGEGGQGTEEGGVGEAGGARRADNTDSDSGSDSSIGDIDSVGSHIAANYSTFDDGEGEGGERRQGRDPNRSDPSRSESQRRPVQTSSERQVLLQAPRGLRRSRRRRHGRKSKTAEWKLAVATGWIVVAHFILITVVTLVLVSTLPSGAFFPPESGVGHGGHGGSGDHGEMLPPPLLTPPSPLSSQWSSPALERRLQSLSLPSPTPTPPPPRHQLISRWATFLGLTGTILACAQYVPQLVHTYRTRLVGSLSIPMMVLQVPGSVIFVYSLAVRPGIEWSSLLAYISTGVLQAALLVMCCCWKARQRRVGVDDFGVPTHARTSDSE